MNNPGPMVVFATPGMLHGGLSLTIFEEWCTSEANMIIMPGYCVAGTIGHKILNGTKKIEFKKGKVRGGGGASSHFKLALNKST
jgi:integrator complex subunit 11